MIWLETGSSTLPLSEHDTVFFLGQQHKTHGILLPDAMLDIITKLFHSVSPSSQDYLDHRGHSFAIDELLHSRNTPKCGIITVHKSTLLITSSSLIQKVPDQSRRLFPSLARAARKPRQDSAVILQRLRESVWIGCPW